MIISNYSENAQHNPVKHHKHFDSNMHAEALCNGLYYKLREKECTTIYELFKLVRLASKYDCVVLNGHLSSLVTSKDTLYRRKSDYGYINDGQNWFYLDVDGFETNTNNLESQLNQLFNELPELLQQSSHVVHLSSSYRTKPNILKAHIFFILDEQLTVQEIKTALHNLGLCKEKCPWFDPKVYAKSGVCFVADPVFDSNSPYTGERVFHVSKVQDSIPVAKLDTVQSKTDESVSNSVLSTQTHIDVRDLPEHVQHKMAKGLVDWFHANSCKGNSDSPTSTLAFGLMKFGYSNAEIAYQLNTGYTGSQDVSSKVQYARSKFNKLSDFDKYMVEKPKNHEKYAKRDELRKKYDF